MLAPEDHPQTSVQAGRRLPDSSKATDAASSATSSWTAAELTRPQSFLTHDVRNQASPLTNYNAYLCDPALISGVCTHGGSWGEAELVKLGACVGSPLWQKRAEDAHRHPPRLETHDRFGNRRDAVEYHSAYHQCLGLGLESGAASFAWLPENRGRKGAHVVRGALLHLMYQLEPGVCCPIVMTFAAVPALMRQRTQDDRHGYVAEWLAKLISRSYSGADVPVLEKPGATMGMSMTEKQGGSDVRGNTTTAKPVIKDQKGPGDAFTLVGHKWFTSAPMGDAFLTLAQTDEGVSCFIVPRWLPDGSRNVGFTVQRLKEKLGDKSNASSEVEYREAWGVMLGDAGRGVRTIVDMVIHTRLDVSIGSSALMRLAAQQAAQHARSRSAFGSELVNQPLMRGVLADLALESEAAMAMWLRLAHAFDESLLGSTVEADFARLAAAVAKYYICKRTPMVVCEALECFGGNGYVEEGPMPRIFRQSPLNSIWEGSGNVICLDVIRALKRDPASAKAVVNELEAALPKACERGVAGCGYTHLVEEIKIFLGEDPAILEPRARKIVDKLAIALQASTLLLHGDPMVASAFLIARVPAGGALPGHHFGAASCDLEKEIVDHLIQRLFICEVSNPAVPHTSRL